MRTEVVVNWAAVAAVSLAIWGLGSDSASVEHTSRILRPLLEWLFPGMSPALLDTVHRAIRKVAHTVEYGVLAVLVLRALLLTWTMPLARGAALAIGFVLVLGAADERRQSFSSKREGAATDVLLDVAGACVFLSVVQALPRRARWTLIRRRD